MRSIPNRAHNQRYNPGIRMPDEWIEVRFSLHVNPDRQQVGYAVETINLTTDSLEAWHYEPVCDSTDPEEIAARAWDRIMTAVRDATLPF